jgi:hypothetical protein
MMNEKTLFAQQQQQQPKDPFELIAILLVSHGSSGSHLLFKYPFADLSHLKGNFFPPRSNHHRFIS